MIPTIEVEIDANGSIHPINPNEQLPQGRALITFFDPYSKPIQNQPKGQAKETLNLLKSSRFANRPKASVDEVEKRIHELRHNWE